MKGIPPFEASASAFTAALDEATRDLSFVGTARETRKVLHEVLPWDRKADLGRSFDVAAELLKMSFGLDAVFRGILVVVAGSYEEFIRQLIRSIVREMNGMNAGISTLPAKLVRSNRIKSAEAIRALENPRDHFQLDADVLCVNLGTCHSKSSRVTFNEEAFVFDITNVNEQRIDDIFEKLDFQFNWDQIGANSGLATILGTKDSRETAKAVKAFVNEFIRKRNSVAHTGVGGAAITADYVFEAIKFFDRFGEALMITLAKELGRKIERYKKFTAAKAK